MNKITIMRKKIKLHKRDVAKYLGVSLREYSNMEKNLNFTDLNQVIGLMTLFKCTFTDIVPIEGTWEPFDIEKREIERIDYKPDLSKYTNSKGNITLYKYKPFSDYVMSDILNNEIIMSYAKDLNDPFEALCGYTINGKDCIGYSKYDGIAIASFSRVPDNPMMWALYSQKYKGLCYELEVNVESVRSKKFLIGPVKYDEYKPMIKIDSHDDLGKIKNNEYYHSLLFTKRIEWESEQEVRIIYEPDHAIMSDSIEYLIETDGKIGRFNNQHHFFKDFVMKQVIIGYLMNKSDRIKVISWARQKNIKVSIAYPNNYKAIIDFNY